MLQRLIIAYAQVKADNTSENINKMRQRICFLYQTKEVTKKVYYNIINLMKAQSKMDTIFMKSQLNKVSRVPRCPSVQVS